MANVRIIPRLDIKGPNLVKGVHLEGLRVLGKPGQFAKHYYESGADELLYMDVVASLYGRNHLHEIITTTAKEIFIPLTVGGGLRTVEDIRSVLRAGADKVAINTAAIDNPDLIRKAAVKFGSSTIVVSIEAIKHDDGTYEAYTDNGRQATGVNVFDWARHVEKLGAGELMVTSINQEGTGKGYDVPLTRRIAELVNIPVIACGGAGSRDHVRQVIQDGKAHAASVASILHYDFITRSAQHSEDYTGEGNIEFLKSKRSYTKVDETTLPDLKNYLVERGIDCRTAPIRTTTEVS
jgi:imidazole glycerol-phosphate synthase subunit HisF